MFNIRLATVSDIPAITRIYNEAIVDGGSTSDLVPQTFDQRRAWVESHVSPYAVFVAEEMDASDGDEAGHDKDSGDAGRRGEAERAGEVGETKHSDRGEVVAFGALSVFYDRPGYDGVADLAYYVARDHHRHGLGTAMLDFLIAEARRRGMRKLIAVIFTNNAGSTALVHHAGFTRFGLLPNASRSTAGMHDLTYWFLDL